MKTIVLVRLLIAALVYALGLYLFLPLLETGYRPAVALAPALGLLFGPAGAAGVALGSYLFDLRHEFNLGTPLGILGNFILAYLPYRVALRLPGFSPRPRLSARWIISFLYLGLLGAFSCGTVIGFGLDGARAAAFAERGVGIAMKNFLMVAWLGWLPLFLQPWLARRGWTVAAEPFVDSARKKTGFVLMKTGLLFAFILGALVSSGVIPSPIQPIKAAALLGSVAHPAAAAMVPGMVLFIAGVILM